VTDAPPRPGEVRPGGPDDDIPPPPRHLAPRPSPGGPRGPRGGNGDDEGGGGGGGGGDDDHRRGRWAVPVLLLLVAGGSAAGAMVLDREDTTTEVGTGAAVTTPVLSARRVPELVAEPVARRRLDADLDAWLAASPADTCLVVEDAGQHVYEHNPTAPLTGASTQKLLTATALLLALGPDARLQTTAVAASAPANGVVAGDLFVVGGGDSLLATPAWRDHFTRDGRAINDVDGLAQAIVDAGVTRIDGGIVGDGTRYDDVRYHPAWPRRFFDQDVVGPIDALMTNDGFAAFPPTGEGDAATVPATDPGADAARVLTERLRARGVTVAGEPRAGRAPEGAAPVASLPSLTVREMVAEMLNQSDNETAEAAIKEVGRTAAGEGSWTAGAQAATQLLTDAGVQLENVAIVDGSGLSIENDLTCNTLVDVLTREETGPVIREGLSVAGETGTLAEPWDGTAADGRLRAKTGTLRNATALAGEIDLNQGGVVTFAYVANVPDPNEVTSQGVGLTGLAELLMQYPRGVDVAQLVPAEPQPPRG
jgi:D-alanyl-D-alanine carboxypeptidase/D-alanyl-D-alanine-endopeptidase (penicillin-binding protein 4)